MTTNYGRIIKNGLLKGLIFNVVLFVILFISRGFGDIVASIIKQHSITYGLSLFLEMWFVNVVTIMFNCSLFLIPCFAGGVLFSLRLKQINNFIIELLVFTLIYIIGLFVVIIVTREKFEFFFDDATAFVLILLFASINKIIERNRNAKNSSSVIPLIHSWI